MGEEFLRNQAKAYKERRDLTAPSFCKEDLLSGRRDRARRTIRAHAARDAALREGDAVVLSAGAKTVDVIQGGSVVGSVRSEDSEGIADRVRQSGGYLPGAVRQVSALGGDFTVVVPEGDASP